MIVYCRARNLIHKCERLSTKEESVLVMIFVIERGPQYTNVKDSQANEESVLVMSVCNRERLLIHKCKRFFN